MQECAQAWRALSRWRRLSGGACGLLVLGLWGACGAGGLPLWPWLAQALAGLAALVLLSTLVSQERRGRRGHLTLALLLLASTLALQLGSGPALGPALRAQGQAWISLRWVSGIVHWPWPFWGLGLPFMALTLVVLRAEAFLRPWVRTLALLGLGLCLLAGALKLGHHFAVDWRAVPTAVMALLLLVLPFRMRGDDAYAAVPLMLVCAAGLLGRLLGLWQLSGPVLNAVTALAMVATAACWMAWYAWLPQLTLMNELASAAQAQEKAQAEAAEQAAQREARMAPAFDLNAHLDSDEAQEGADKYTRE